MTLLQVPRRTHLSGITLAVVGLGSMVFLWRRLGLPNPVAWLRATTHNRSQMTGETDQKMTTTHGPQVEEIDQMSVDRPGHDVTSADMSAHPTDTTDTSPVTSVHHVDHTDLQAGACGYTEEDLEKLAEEFRATQGDWCEMEAGFAGYESMNNFHRCRKNPGHSSFVCMPDLTMSRLPDGNKTECNLKFIHNLSNHVVKLHVDHTSTSRTGPFVMGNGLRWGTGFICSSLENESISLDEEAISLDEVISPNSTFNVMTANHVVWDDDEVKSTRVELFFDDDQDRSGVVIAEGISMEVCEPDDGDIAIFKARLTRPEQLSDVIEKLSTKNDKPPSFSHDTNFAFCISHPHGVGKRVTFGEVEKVKDYVIFSKNPVDLKELFILITCVKNDFGIEERQFMYFYCHDIETKGMKVAEKHFFLQQLVNNKMIKKPDFPTYKKYDEIFGTTALLSDNAKNAFEIASMIDDGADEGETSDIVDSERNGKLPKTYLAYLEERAACHKSYNASQYADFCDRMETLSEAFTGQVNKEIIDPITCSYRVDTCPGSSGAPAISVFQSEVCVVPHSRARRSEGGLSGLGFRISLSNPAGRKGITSS